MRVRNLEHGGLAWLSNTAAIQLILAAEMGVSFYLLLTRLTGEELPLSSAALAYIMAGAMRPYIERWVRPS